MAEFASESARALSVPVEVNSTGNGGDAAESAIGNARLDIAVHTSLPLSFGTAIGTRVCAANMILDAAMKIGYVAFRGCRRPATAHQVGSGRGEAGNEDVSESAIALYDSSRWSGSKGFSLAGNSDDSGRQQAAEERVEELEAVGGARPRGETKRKAAPMLVAHLEAEPPGTSMSERRVPFSGSTGPSAHEKRWPTSYSGTAGFVPAVEPREAGSEEGLRREDGEEGYEQILTAETETTSYPRQRVEGVHQCSP